MAMAQFSVQFQQTHHSTIQVAQYKYVRCAHLEGFLQPDDTK